MQYWVLFPVERSEVSTATSRLRTAASFVGPLLIVRAQRQKDHLMSLAMKQNDWKSFGLGILLFLLRSSGTCLSLSESQA